MCTVHNRIQHEGHQEKDFRNEEVIKLVVAEIHQCVGIFTVAMFPDYTNYRFLCVMAVDYL